ncbi:hypothetical protein Efla_006626 [Eimeria flavescens]
MGSGNKNASVLGVLCALLRIHLDMATSLAYPELGPGPLVEEVETETVVGPQAAQGATTAAAPTVMQPYSIGDEYRGPSVSLRVVDESGQATEIPINFSEARVEPRGFWGDVAMNGLSLFAASVCILLLKEAFSWSAAKRRQAKAAARQAAEMQRRAALTAQLEAADLEIRAMRKMSREGRTEDLNDSARRLMEFLDSHRLDMKELDAPALTAYLDSLTMQATQILRSHTRTQAESGSSRGFGYADDFGGRSPAIADSSSPRDERLESTEQPAEASDSRQSDFLFKEAETQKESMGEGGEQIQYREARVAAPQVESEREIKVEQPDMDIVHRLLSENPGMHPSKIISMAKELTKKRRQKELRRP